MAYEREFEEFKPDIEAMIMRYVEKPLEEVDWERLEAETRLVVAAHFPPHVRFEAYFVVNPSWGPDIEMLVTEKGAVRYQPE